MGGNVASAVPHCVGAHGYGENDVVGPHMEIRPIQRYGISMRGDPPDVIGVADFRQGWPVALSGRRAAPGGSEGAIGKVDPTGSGALSRSVELRMASGRGEV